MTQTSQSQISNPTSIAELEGWHPAEGTIVTLDAGGRSGKFRGTTTDISTEVTADTQQGIYIAAFDDATGASGGWVRQYGQAVDSRPKINTGWFGAIGDNGTTDNATPIGKTLTYAANNGTGVKSAGGRFYVGSGITIPEVAGPYFGEDGLDFEGAGRNATVIYTDQDIAVFDFPDFTNFRHMTIEQTGTAGTGKAFYSDEQVRFCTFEDLNIIKFKYGHLIRFSLWCSWRDIYYVENTCGVRLARNASMEDQTNPSAVASWNQATGWFNNQLTFDNILCNGGEVGIWASCMGTTFNNVTCQNQETDGTTNSVLPTSTKGTGMWLEGGGSATDSFNNVLINYYVEDTLNALVVKEHDSLVINGWFTQGVSGGNALLDVDGSTVTISGQTGQSSGYTYRILGNDSTVCSHGELVASGASDSLTNTLYSPTGVMPITAKLATVTMSPNTSGTITLSGSDNQIAYERHGNIVYITGRIDVSSVSSPVGTYVEIDSLPYTVAQLNERAGNGAIACTYFGTPDVLPGLFLENTTTLRIYIDASTVAGSDSFYFTGTYFTD